MAAQLAVASAIVKQDGFGALYRGLSAGLLRQATYTTARLGIFQELSTYLKKANDGKVGAQHRKVDRCFPMCRSTNILCGCLQQYGSTSWIPALQIL